MVYQAKEIARRCVERPLKKKPNDSKFEPRPSLREAVEFLIDCVKRIPTESCQFCKKTCFPADPNVGIQFIPLSRLMFYSQHTLFSNFYLTT